MTITVKGGPYLKIQQFFSIGRMGYWKKSELCSAF